MFCPLNNVRFLRFPGLIVTAISTIYPTPAAVHSLSSELVEPRTEISPILGTGVGFLRVPGMSRKVLNTLCPETLTTTERPSKKYLSNSPQKTSQRKSHWITQSSLSSQKTRHPH